MKKAIMLIMFCVASTSNIASGFVFGGSNFPPLTPYPRHSCIKPIESVSISRYDPAWARDHHNREMEQYRDCIKTYIGNAKNDIKRIQEIINDVIDEHNSTP